MFSVDWMVAQKEEYMYFAHEKITSKLDEKSCNTIFCIK